MQNTPRTRITIVSIITASIAFAAIAFPAGIEATTATAGPAQPAPSVTVVGGTEHEQGLVDWAVSRFETARLPLPSLTVAFHETDEGCRGFQGYYSSTAATVDICNRGTGKTDQRHTLLHELAHAWSFAHLSAADQHDFSDHRGLDHWHSGEVAWWQMGQEQAAEIVAWGLQDDDEFKSIWLFLEECESLAASYRTISGTDPLHANSSYCA